MEVKTRLVADASQPDLLVGLRCSGCREYVIHVVPLSKVVPRLIWSKARTALEPLDGDQITVPGVYYCGDCAPEDEPEEDGGQDGESEPGGSPREVEARGNGSGEGGEPEPADRSA